MNALQNIFDKQQAYFASDATKSYEWRIDQLDRLIRMLKENETRLSEASKKDFKTALQEHIFEVVASIGSIEFMRSQVKEWMKPVEAPIPKFLAVSGHKGTIWSYADHLPIQRAVGVVPSSSRHCIVGGQPVRFEAIDRNTRNQRIAAGVDSEVFRTGSCVRCFGQPRYRHGTLAASVRFHLRHGQCDRRKSRDEGGSRTPYSRVA
jgi:hypothetical protein